MMTIDELSFKPYGDCAIIVSLNHSVISHESNDFIAAVTRVLEEKLPAVLELIPAYDSVVVLFDQLQIDLSEFMTQCRQVISAENLAVKKKSTNTIKIPICYETEFSPDMSEVANITGCSPEDIIQLHQKKTYKIFMTGFSPGFMYLGILDPKLSVHRKSAPRKNVPAGSVGLAGLQTGIYALDSPGGWQIIGRTPVDLLNSKHNPTIGDRIQFKEISSAEYYGWKG